MEEAAFELCAQCGDGDGGEWSAFMVGPFLGWWKWCCCAACYGSCGGLAHAISPANGRAGSRAGLATADHGGVGFGDAQPRRPEFGAARRGVRMQAYVGGAELLLRVATG